MRAEDSVLKIKFWERKLFTECVSSPYSLGSLKKQNIFASLTIFRYKLAISHKIPVMRKHKPVTRHLQTQKVLKHGL